MADRQDIIRKIESALRLASDAGATEAEREAAAAAARSLMAKYDVEEAEFIVGRSTTDMRRDVIFTNIRITREGDNAFVPEERLLLCHYIGGYFDCKTMVQELPATADLDTGKAIPGGKFLTLIGFRGDVDLAKGLYQALVLHLVVESGKEEQRAVNYMRSFAMGYAEEIRDRLMVMKAARKKDAESTQTGGTSTALVLVKKTDVVASVFDEMFPQRGSYRTAGVKADATGVARGRKAGKAADLGNNVAAGSRKEIG